MKIEETFDLRNALGEGDRRLLQLEALVKFALFDSCSSLFWICMGWF